MHVRVPLRKAALFVTPPFSAVKTPLWCIIPSRPCFPVQRPSFYPANSLMAQCICELRERDIPEPYTRNPQPQPKLQNLSTSPKTLNPKPRSLNPTPELNQNLDTGPKPRIVDPQVRWATAPLTLTLTLAQKSFVERLFFCKLAPGRVLTWKPLATQPKLRQCFTLCSSSCGIISTYRNQKNGVQLTCPPIRASHDYGLRDSNYIIGPVAVT